MLPVILTPVIRAIATIHKLPACPLVCFSVWDKVCGMSSAGMGEETQECGEYFVLGVQSLSNEALLEKCIISDSRLAAESRRFIFKAVILKQNKPTTLLLVREKSRFVVSLHCSKCGSTKLGLEKPQDQKSLSQAGLIF